MTADSEPLNAPDQEQPDRIFVDGASAYVVGVLPASMPIFGTQEGVPQTGPSSLIMTVAYFVAGIAVSRWVDNRWKVAVSRRRLKTPSFWRVVSVEFVDSRDEAEQRRSTLVGQWQSGALAEAPRLRFREIARMRVQSLPQRGKSPTRDRGERRRAMRLLGSALIPALLATICIVDGTWSGRATSVPFVLLTLLLLWNAWSAWMNSRRG